MAKKMKREQEVKVEEGVTPIPQTQDGELLPEEENIEWTDAEVDVSPPPSSLSSSNALVGQLQVRNQSSRSHPTASARSQEISPATL